MPSFAEERHLPYSQQKIFDLVADVERYPEFLPWCIGCRVTKRENQLIEADMLVGFKMVRERFTSRVSLSSPNSIQVEYLDGPFRYLNNNWTFNPTEDGCVIHFYIDFDFRSRLLRRLIGPLFSEAVRRMVSAFDNRALALYGTELKGASTTAA